MIVTPAGKTKLLEASRGLIDAAQQGAEQAEAAEKDDDKKDDEQKQEDEPAPANASLESIRDAMGSVKDLLAAADKQITQLAVGIRIDDSTALCVSARLLFASEGDLSKWAADVKVPPAGLLAGLPPGKFTLAYGGTTVQFHASIAGLFERMMQTGLSQFGLSEETRKKLAEIVSRHRLNQTSSGMLLGQLRPGDTLLATSMSIERVKDATEQVKLTREMFELFSQMRLPGADPAKAVYSVSDIKVGELPALELMTDLSAAFAAGVKAARPRSPKCFAACSPNSSAATARCERTWRSPTNTPA